MGGGTPEYMKCTVCFVHVYDETLPLGRVRDHDNYEEKHVLDVLANFFLKSDGGLYVDIQDNRKRRAPGIQCPVP